MSDKPATSAGDFFAIPEIAFVALEGRDAAKFAHAQFMSDVASLAPRHWHWSGWLTPKGRVVALFALLKFDDERLLLALLDVPAFEFVAQLQRFVFRSRLQIRVRDDLHASGTFRIPDEAAAGRFSGDDTTGIELDLGGSGGPRCLRIAAAPAVQDGEAAVRWTAFDLAHGLPRLPSSQREQWTPQQLSLDRLKAYSVRKGCYPGQEIVARTHFLGQAKRALARLSVAGGAAGDAVRDGEKVIGTVVSAAGAEALAVLPVDPAATSPQVDGKAASALPLLDGLGR